MQTNLQPDAQGQPPLDLLAAAEPAPAPGTPRPVEERARRAAEITGAEIEQVEQLPFDLSALNEEGVFINIDARGFGLLDRRLDWGALGITLPKDSTIAFHPPRIGVLPNKYRLPLQRPAAQAHNALHKWSFHFRLTETVFETPAYRWIPWNAFEEFEQEFDAAVKALAEAKQLALDNYDDILAEVREIFTRVAEQSARRLEATTGEQVPANFREKIVEGALALVPSRDDIERRLVLKRRPGVMLLGSEMLAEQRTAAEERLRLTEVKSREKVVRAEADARQQLVQMDLLAGEQRIRLEQDFIREEQEREREVKERIRSIKLEEARKRVQESLSPITEGVGQLHAKLYEAALSMREALTNNGFVPGSTAKRMKELTRWFKLMNFQSDADLENLLNKLSGLAAQKAKNRATQPIDAVLGDIVRFTEEKAKAALETQRIDALEI